MFEKLDCLRLINFIEKSSFFTTGKIRHKKILIAFSGGQDSSCLLAIFYILRKKWDFELGVVYCNHCWNDSAFPAFAIFQILLKYNLPFYLVEAPNSSAIKPEQKARNWRYSSFYNILKQEAYDFVLTGHSLSDCSETVLFNLARGSGVKGICALKEYQIFQMPLAWKTKNFWESQDQNERPLSKLSRFLLSSMRKPTSKLSTNSCFINASKPQFSLLSTARKFILNRWQQPKSEKTSFKAEQKIKKKEFFIFKKTTFSIDSLFNSLNIQKFGFQNKTTTLTKQTQTLKKIQVVKTIFSIYLQRLKKFQKLDPSGSLISYFKPSKFKNNKNLFFNFFLEKLAIKKEKEKKIFLEKTRENFQNFSPKDQSKGQKQLKNFLNTTKVDLILSTFPHSFSRLQKICLPYKAGCGKLLRKPGSKCAAREQGFLKNNVEKFVFSGPLPKNHFLVFRPLIKINRETLFLFSKIMKLPICYDSSNKNLNLARNSIRKLIIPLLKKINPSAEEKIYKFSRILEFYIELTGSVECPLERLEIFIP